VIAALKAAFIQGRLSRDEFDLRVGRALGSRTYAELAALTAELAGPPARSALQADARLRRRARGITGILAAIVVIAAAISMVALSYRPAPVAPPRHAGAVMYVAASNGVIPVRTATNTAGRPIKIGAIPAAMAITPDGKTAYIADLHPDTVTPVTTATNTAGRPIHIGGFPWAVAITPDGKTAYVVDIVAHGRGPTTVIPVSTATNTPGKPIKISGTPVAIAITPDGKTAYIATAAYIAGSCAGCPVGTVIPVSTATNTPGQPIKIGRIPQAIAITPADGGGMLQKLLPAP
jgi:YVTN family beta-propeller protein